jgi:hypothetical protein
MADDDVYSRKKTFLDAQVRRLTTTLAPSRDYKAAAANAEDGEKLTDTMVENAIYKCIPRQWPSNGSESCNAEALPSSV